MEALLAITVAALVLSGVVIWKQRRIIDHLNEHIETDPDLSRAWLKRPPAR